MAKEKKTANSLSLEETKVKIVELQGAIFKLQMQKTTGQLQNTALIRATRKELARVKTFHSQKSHSAAASAKK